MDSKFIVRETVINDVFILTNNLRQADINEISALNSTPLMSLLEGYIYSDECYTTLVNGEIAGIFGVSTSKMPKKIASIWFLGSDLINLVPREWLKTGKNYINKFLRDYGVLVNAVYVGNTLHYKWLKKMGALFSAPLENNFKHFYIIKEI